MTSRPSRSAESRICSGDARPSPRSEWSCRSALPTLAPDALEHGPLLGRAPDVAFEHACPAADPFADVGIAVAGRGQLERWLEGRRELRSLMTRGRRDE